MTDYREPLPLFSLVRSADPETSVEAAKSASPDRATAVLVRMVMEDGKPRTDEEIARAVQAANGGRPTDSRIRHGRKHLADLGLLVEAGRGVTSNGAGCRVWRRA